MRFHVSLFFDRYKRKDRGTGLQREIVWYLCVLAGVSLILFATLILHLASDVSILALGQLAWTVLFYAIAFTAVLGWFGYRLTRYVVVAPLREIEKAAQAIANGDPHAVVPIERDNEIGGLGRAIELMRANLLDRQEKLADYAQSLESLNDQLEEAQRALLRGEKLASVGRLASGIAHEVGNPLGAVLGYLSILRSSNQDSTSAELLTRCEGELLRISRIVRQLLDYARPSEPPDKPCDINDIVKGTVEGVMGQETPPGVRFHLDLAGDLPALWLDPDPLRQVLWNLLRNAVDAVGDSGGITIKTEVLTVENLRASPMGILFRARTRKGDSGRPEILEQRRSRRKDDSSAEKGRTPTRRGEIPSFLFSSDGQVVRISIEDTGPGISLEDTSRIFDPFFSTKPPGKGTGLGLFVSLNLVESLGGFLDLQTESEKGATFLILLPTPKSGTQNLRGDSPLIV